MNPRVRRILITALVLLVALAVLAPMFFSARRTSSPQPQAASSTPAQNPQTSTPNSNPPPPDTDLQSGQPAESDAVPNAAESNSPQAPVTFSGLRAIAPEGEGDRSQTPASLGSLDPRVHLLRVDLTRRGAGVDAILFADIWQTAAAKRQSEEHLRQLQPGEPIDSTKLQESQRMVLQTTRAYNWSGQSTQIPVLAARAIEINGTTVPLLSESVWANVGPGRFETQIVDESGTELVRVNRQFTLGVNYEIELNQTIQNLTDQPLEIRWVQYGPGDLPIDPGGYIDRRRMAFGYLPDPQQRPDLVLSGDVEYERNALLKIHNRAQAAPPQEQRAQSRLWPNSTSSSRNYALSWFASTSRYFGLMVHPTASSIARGDFALADEISEITVTASDDADPPIFTYMFSPTFTIGARQQQSLDLGVYAGPLDRHVLAQPPYVSLALKDVIRYSMGGCCNFLSFQWLAVLLLNFLALLHDYIVFDWGMAIIFLVIVVRTLLHPLTKKSQINMQRFGKQMSAMKPEIDKLQKKYASDPKRLQIEQMKLMREHGLNPFQMLGCLPMFLQMPIWIALWAMLYLAFDIRHEPAFYGLFQQFGGWQFLGDLSSPDHFWMLPGGGFTIPLLNARIDALNLLPLLLGLVFFFQQKYMSPPPTPNMSPEQMQQQRIMKIMMVVLFPLFLYKAPSGLTLYIITSSCIGIMESKYIRSHIEQLDLRRPGAGPDGTPVLRDNPPKKPKDSLGRLWAEKLEAARRKRDAEPPRSFKKRK